MSYATTSIEQSFKSGAAEAKDLIKQTAVALGSKVNEKVENYLNNLTDIESHWAKEDIQVLVAKEVVKGYPDGTYRPDNQISVAEFITVLIKSTYTEIDYVQTSPWYQVYLDKALEMGVLIAGEVEDYNRPITRYEMAVMIARAGESTDSIKVKVTQETSFTDDSEIKADGKKYIEAVSHVGIITGYPDGNFGPNNKASRAEAAVMLNRFINLEKPLVQEKSLPEQMIENVLNTDMIEMLSVPAVQALEDESEYIFTMPGCKMADGKVMVGDETNLEDGLEKIVKMTQVLVAHAQKNGHMVVLLGGGNGIGIAYGENYESLRRAEYMFEFVYKRQSDWANELEVDGVTYALEKEIDLNYLFDLRRLYDKEPTSMSKRDAYRAERIDMEEDVLYAFYDGLRAFDPDNAEYLFLKATKDYQYAKTHEYKDQEKNEFMTIGNSELYKTDCRASDDTYKYILYSFIKK